MVWTHKHFVDKATGKIHRIYRYDGKPCKRITLNSRLCDQLAGYALIEKDLRSAIAWMNLINQLHEKAGISGLEFHNNEDRELGLQVKGLFVAALTFYGKCFSKCEGRPVKLEKAQLGKEFHDLHEHGIGLRHNFAAHSGATGVERATIALVFPQKLKKAKPGKPRNMPINIYTELHQPDYSWDTGGDVKWIDLFEECRRVAKSKKEFLVLKIRKDEVMAKEQDYWINK